MHGKAPLTSILLCLEKIAVSHGPFNGLDSLKRTKGFRNPYHNKTKKQNVYDWSFWREIRDGNREKLF